MSQKREQIKGAYYVIAFAILFLCFAVAICAFAIGLKEKEVVNTPSKGEPSYSDIYNAISSIKKSQTAWDFMLSGDMVAYAKTESTSNAISKNDYSQTTIQVEGVDEADIVKTNGEYIFSFNSSKAKINIIKISEKAEKASEIILAKPNFYPVSQLYLADNKLVVLGNSTLSSNCVTYAYIYDVENPENPLLIYECSQSGFYNDSRLIGDKLYLISNYMLDPSLITEKKPESYVPIVSGSNARGVVEPSSICIDSNCAIAGYTVICGYSIGDGKVLGTQSLMGGTNTVYCSLQSIITAGYPKDNQTAITRYSLNDGKVKLEAKGNIKGNLLNQFSIDEYEGNFRFVTTNNRNNDNSLYILNKKLEQIGKIENIAPNERVYSVRFMGDTAYFVTFRQIDPLFSVDLSDPKNPQIMGELKITGFSNYLYPFGKGRLLGIGQEAEEQTGNTLGIKIAMFDISNMENVTELTKSVLEVNYSNALNSHKATFFDSDLGLIGFPVWNGRNCEYRIFKFENNQFSAICQVSFKNSFGEVRGIKIKDKFFVVAEDRVITLETNNFSEIGRILKFQKIKSPSKRGLFGILVKF